MADDFGKEVRELYAQDESDDSKNREEAKYDLQFAAGEQWDARVREYRESGERAFPLPCLTINTLPQFIGQVVGDRRANQTSIKVLPREDGDKNVAEVRSELIRSIELQSKAERIYTQSFEQAVTCGMGNFRVDLDYAYDDAFERDLFIRGIPNPLAVMWPSHAGDPTAKDARRCFVRDRLEEDEYTERFPKAAKSSLFDNDTIAAGWCEGDAVFVAEYWKLIEREREIALFADGSVKDAKGAKNGDLFIGPDGKPRIRKSKCKYAVMVMTNGQEQLTDPFELKLPRLPIIRVMGREVWVGDRRVRFGLTRFARDPQRLKNYWRSVVAELLMGAPRANYIASASAIKNRTNDWPNTLVYNDGAEMPQAITAMNLGAIINEAEMCAQDMKDTTGLHDASLGAKSNETSGVAIQNRQHEGDIATIGYHDNMNAAMQEAGEVLNALLDVVYDTPRTIRTIGADEAVRLLRVNDPDFKPTELVKENINLATGRYDVSIATGPAYMTRRQEAAAGMIEFARSAPDVVARAGDLIAKAQDWPLADEFAKRLRPPDIPDEDGEEPAIPPQVQQAMQAMQEQMQQIVAEAQQLQAENEQLKGKHDLDEQKLEIDAGKLELDRQKLDLEKFKADTERMNLKAQGQLVTPEDEEQQAFDAEAAMAKDQRDAALQAANIEVLNKLADAVSEMNRPRRKIPIRDDSGFIVSVEEVAA